VTHLDHLGNRDKEQIRATFTEGQVDLVGLDVPRVGRIED